MATNIAALKTALETDRQYDALVRAGSNGLIVNLLNTEDRRLPKRWQAISMSEFLDITAGESFTAEQEERIRTYIAVEGRMRLDKLGIRTWALANVSPRAATALTAVGQVTGKPGDAFADEGSAVSLRDVRAAVLQISKSLIKRTGQVQ